MAFAWGESGPVGSPGEFLQPACRADPMPWGRRERKLCTAAAEAGSPGGGIPQEGAPWCLPEPGSGQCSPAGLPEAPSGHTGTEFLGGIPLNPEEEAEEGSWAGCPAREACWGAGACWGPVGRAGTEEAAWSDGQSHRARAFLTTCFQIFCPPPLIGSIFFPLYSSCW